MGISLSKVGEQAPELLSLAKKAQFSLSKHDLVDTRAKVALVLDYSGSMNSLYRSGAMQQLAEKVLSLGVQLDDDGAIDLFVFDSGSAYLGEINLNDYQGSIDRLRGNRHMGTTNYAAAFLAVRDHYFGNQYNTTADAAAAPQKRGLFGLGKSAPVAASQNTNSPAPAELPVYAVFLTDGAPDSKPAAVKALTEVSHAPIFWKFLSIGSEEMAFLQKLDDLSDRFIDNADYKPIGSVDSLSPAALYDVLLDEYSGWLKEARQKGLIS